jgi:pimeloyl-ACP methyl ester carboxylesterase
MSLLGYGGTAERRNADDADIAHEAEIVEAVVRSAGGPVHLVGHSFGGLVALAVALRNHVTLESLSIVEAPIVELLRLRGEHQHYLAFRQMTEAYFTAFRDGDEAAIEAMMDFFGGAGTFAAWPERIRRYAIETTPVNLLDWAGACGFQPTPDALAGVLVPTLVLCGRESHPAMRRANELLGQCLGNAWLSTIGQARHFMISTHPEEVAWAVAHHVVTVAGLRREVGAAAQ